MKRMFLFGFALVLTASLSLSVFSAEKIQVAVFTGGHDFEKTFWTLFDGYDNLEITRLEQPKANEIFVNGSAKKFDVLVFYDMWTPITEEQKKGFVDYLKSGKGLVALHHCIASYQDWPEWIDILGALYNSGTKPITIKGKPYSPSAYQHDQDMNVKVVDKNHPITKGISDFSIVDEWYGNVYISPDVHPLLETDHPKSMKTLAWTNKYDKARVTYIELGHDTKAYSKPEYRKLVYQAIEWAAKR